MRVSAGASYTWCLQSSRSGSRGRPRGPKPAKRNPQGALQSWKDADPLPVGSPHFHAVSLSKRAHDKAVLVRALGSTTDGQAGAAAGEAPGMEDAAKARLEKVRQMAKRIAKERVAAELASAVAEIERLEEEQRSLLEQVEDSDAGDQGAGEPGPGLTEAAAPDLEEPAADDDPALPPFEDLDSAADAPQPDTAVDVTAGDGPPWGQDVLEALQWHEERTIVTAPPSAMQGQPLHIYFNQAASDPLRDSERVVAVGAFDDWMVAPFEAELAPCPSPGSTWWHCEVLVPHATKEMHFVLSDGNTLYDNNDTQDYRVKVVQKGQLGPPVLEFQAPSAPAPAPSAPPSSPDLNPAPAPPPQEQPPPSYDAPPADAAPAAPSFLEVVRQASAADTAADVSRTAAPVEMAGVGGDHVREAIAEVEVTQEVKDEVEAYLDARLTSASAALARLAAQEGTELRWRTEPATVRSGEEMRLVYEAAGGPLAGASSVSLSAAVDDWTRARQLGGPMTRTGPERWEVALQVPEDALVLDFVFQDDAGRYDNNGGADHHAAIDAHLSREEWVHIRCVRKVGEMEQAEAVAAAARADRAEVKRARKEEARRAHAQRHAHIFYTDPPAPAAGEQVELYYNPESTLLKGRNEMWLHCGWNRWRHPHPPSPARMERCGAGPWHRATLAPPPDARTAHFVLSDQRHGGLFDNNNEQDYRIDLRGASGGDGRGAGSLHIVHVTVEMAPIAKVGGLGDVVAALGRAVQEEGHRVETIMPKYDILDYSKISNLKETGSFRKHHADVKVFQGEVNGLPVTFLEPSSGEFWHGCIYGRNDDHDRFRFFCECAVKYLRNGPTPDVVHCHDWPTAPVTWMYKDVPSLFTIHNLEYGADLVGRAMEACSLATTVSPTYSKEVAGHGAVQHQLKKFHGVLNGIDADYWDPAADPALPVPYAADTVGEGKAAARRLLQERLGLQPAEGRPLVGVVSRLTHQKGIHLIKHAAWRAVQQGGQFALLGSAPDPRVQGEFEELGRRLASDHPGQAAMFLGYDEQLSHLVYAAADFILVPSMFEPCGLTQLIAMRYGAMPVVRRTGGLADSVFDFDDDAKRAVKLGRELNGFSFDSTDEDGMSYALDRALEAYRTQDFRGMQASNMNQDWSWNRPALEYIDLYWGCVKN